MKNKQIFLLIGPKGAGKSYIGNLIEKFYNIKFIRVEDWAKKIKIKRAVNDESYIKEVFITIEKGIRKTLEDLNEIVFESTGLTSYFDQMFCNLKKDFDVILIKIIAKQELCLKRVKIRELEIHINVSDKEVSQINDAFFNKNMKTNFVIDNNEKNENELIDEIEKIINQ